MMYIFRVQSYYASWVNTGGDSEEEQQKPVSIQAAVSHRQTAESAGTLRLPRPTQLQPGSAAGPWHESVP